ncbi:hypothetical protein BFP71_15380 [Roseivirga misakiensis]|uniref:SMP-30/Gluconolactonase/LRE-like region domain-containing protein n=2 Tax=Roseivirga misakiensis TaxID=1563681 RepID=A0A1E5T0C0_9BACT|nr:hypothetical protein BFP71_15380 [Roseivirga misakiensis]
MTFSLACDGDAPESEPAVLNENDYKVQITAVTDVTNKGDASDIQVKFNTGQARENIQEYRIMIVKSSAVSNLTVESMKSLPNSSYASHAGNQINQELQLDALQNDIDGESVTSDIDYRIAILSIGTFNEETVYVLSEPSTDFKLINNPETSTLVSNMPANDAISIDAAGNIYVSNYGVWDNSIGKGNGTTALKISPAGDVSVFVTGLANPVGNAIDSEGNFYVNDDNVSNAGNLVKVAPDGTKTTIANIQGYPSGLLLGTDGNFYVSNYNIGVVNKVTPDGTITDFVRDERLKGGVGIVYDDNGNIIVGNFLTGAVLSINPSGDISLIGTVPTLGRGSVIGYLTYFEGNVYATSGGGKRIYKVSLGGEVTVFAGSGVVGSSDGEFQDATFTIPNGIAVDKAKRVLYVSDGATTGGANLRVLPLDR